MHSVGFKTQSISVVLVLRSRLYWRNICSYFGLYTSKTNIVVEGDFPTTLHCSRFYITRDDGLLSSKWEFGETLKHAWFELIWHVSSKNNLQALQIPPACTTSITVIRRNIVCSNCKIENQKYYCSNFWQIVLGTLKASLPFYSYHVMLVGHHSRCYHSTDKTRSVPSKWDCRRQWPRGWC